jgi:hypothetical protein
MLFTLSSAASFPEAEADNADVPGLTEWLLLRIIDPSVFERINVIWTPGLDASRDRFSNVGAA